MYSLKEFWHLRNLPVPEGEWDGNVICIETNVEWTFGTNETHGFLSCYTFTIVTRGWVTIVYNNRELTLHEGDLYIYSPGFEVTVLSSSSDYSGICLLADEHFTLELPSVHDSIRAAYLSVVELQQPQLTLSDDDYRHILELMQLALRYQQSLLPNANESLRMLYSIFLNDLTGLMERTIHEYRFPKRVEELFLAFLHLLPRHFVGRPHRRRLHQPVALNGSLVFAAPDLAQRCPDSRATPLRRDHHLCPFLPAYEGDDSEGV